MDNSHSDRGTAVVIDASATEDDEFGTAVLRSIANEVDADPATLPPLRESIDPDVLNEFRGAGGDSTTAISFEYLDYHVVVTDDGVIELRTQA